MYFKVVDSDDWVKESEYLKILEKLRRITSYNVCYTKLLRKSGLIADRMGLELLIVNYIKE